MRACSICIPQPSKTGEKVIISGEWRCFPRVQLLFHLKNVLAHANSVDRTFAFKKERFLGKNSEMAIDMG